ncbi:MAG: HK97 family phage prohead protease [Rhodobacteraceae bacterium]|nr:HK97 family phage prohead protease [Paracoccaceae bacterium]
MLWGGHNGGLEIRRSADGATVLRGRFPYGVSTILWDGGRSGQARKEVIAPRAFATRVAQQDQDIHFLAGHDFDKPLASRAAGSLTLTDSDEALIFEATISVEMRNVSYVRDFLGGLDAGLIKGVSPGFRIAPTDQAESIRPDGSGVLRTVNSAELFEVSAVTKPAYSDAQIEARAWGIPAPIKSGSQRGIARWR